MKVESLDPVATGGQHFLLDRNTRRSACVIDSVRLDTRRTLMSRSIGWRMDSKDLALESAQVLVPVLPY